MLSPTPSRGLRSGRMQVAYGYSLFCELFTWEEWRGFGYSFDLSFYGDSSFGSPTGRALGIGYQQEVIARLKNSTVGNSGSQISVTPGGNEEIFPLNQSLYFDFTHDTNIISILTAFGLTQFEQPPNASAHPSPHNFTVPRLIPFGARLDVEIIPKPMLLAADRAIHLDGLRDKVCSLGWNLPECDSSRIDRWCKFNTFLAAQGRMPGQASYKTVCFADSQRRQKDRDPNGAHRGVRPLNLRVACGC